MGALGDLYAKLEDKYYDFLDSLDKAGIPVYKVVDAIEGANIPSFPLAVLFLILLAAGIGYLAMNVFLPGQTNLIVAVSDSSGVGIGNATVVLDLGGGDTLSGITDSSGEAEFKVAKNVELKINVSKSPDYEDGQQAFTPVNDSETKSIILARKLSTISKTVNLLKAGSTNQLMDKQVEVDFRCSIATFTQTKSTGNGQITIDVPSNCGTLYATPKNGFTSVSSAGFAVIDTGPIEIFLNEEEVGKGIILVRAIDSTGAAVQGIEVSIILQSSGSAFGSVVQTKSTPQSGTVTFVEVPEGRYYIRTYDPLGSFAEYDSSSRANVQELKNDKTITFDAILERKIIGSIKIVVKDSSTGEAVEGAIVNLKKSAAPVTSEETDSAGKVEFNVGEQANYEVEVDKQGYIIKRISLQPSTNEVEVLISTATIENSQSLKVTVVDEEGKPVENVRISLRDAETNATVGKELVTGIDGVAVFGRVEEGTYYVYALKPGFGEKSTNNLRLNEREINETTIILPIGNGGIKATVLDRKKQPVAGAKVTAVNFFTQNVEAEGITDGTGVAELDVRADKTVFLYTTAGGFLPYTTATIRMQKDVTIENTIEMLTEIRELSLEYQGIQIGDQFVKESETPPLNDGQTYKARFLLLVPQNSSFDEVGAHIRTGQGLEGNTNVLEKDYVFISGINAPYNAIIRGTSYTPPTGYANDSQHNTNAEAKWADVIFAQPGEGIIEIEAEITVRGNAPRGSVLDLWYRAWGKTGNYVRFPVDDVLGSSEGNAQRQALYANAKNKKFSVGPSSLCLNDFCTSISIEDVADRLETGVIDEYFGQVSNRYRMTLSINSISQDLLQNAHLQISNKTSSLAFSNYDFKTVGGAPAKGTAIGSQLDIPVGNIGENDTISGTLDFETKKQGTTILEIAIVSDNQKILKKEITIHSEAAQKLGIEIVPKIIVPFINNNILVQVQDSNGENKISNAKISIKKDGTVIADGETDSDGIFAYTLLAPNAGTRIGILAEKPGFQPIEKEIFVSEDILLSRPQQINEHLVIGTSPSKQLQIVLSNATAIPLTISGIEASTELTQMLNITYDPFILGLTMDVNSDMNASIKIALSKEGALVGEPTVVKGAILFLITNSDASKTWRARLPVEVRIGFGGEVDDAGCFSINPEKWDVFTGTDVKSISIAVQNNCKVGGTDISLRNLKARLVMGTENKIGEFRAKLESSDGQAVLLTTEFQSIAELIAAKSNAVLTLEFKPDNLQSADSKVKIEIAAENLTDAGPEELSRTVNAALNVNDLTQCIQLPTGNLKLMSCPVNTGYGMFGNNFSGQQNYGGYPSNLNMGYGNTGFDTGYRNFDPYQSQYGYGQGLPPNIGTLGQLDSRTGNQNYNENYTPSNIPGSYGYRPGFDSGFSPYSSANNYPGYAQPYLSQPTFPYSNFNAPMYAGDTFNSQFNNQFNCGQQMPLNITNSCNKPVEVTLKTDQGLTADEKKFTIEPGAQKSVNIKPAYFVGRYPVEIGAKIAGSNENPKTIGTVNVQVENPLTLTYRDCISIDPNRTLSFQNFLGKPVTVKVINTCYNEGVRLLENNNSVSFTSQTLRTPTDLGSDPLALIRNWGLLGPPEFITTADGKVAQVLTFEVVKNLQEYCNQAPPAPREGNPFQIVGNLRYFLTSGYYSVNTRALMMVNFMTPYGSPQSVSFPIVLEDAWEALPFAERVVSYGDPKFSPAACIAPKKATVLDFKKLYASQPGQCIPLDEIDNYSVNPYNTQLQGGLFTFASQAPRDTCTRYQQTVQANSAEVGGCGTVDNISELSPSTIEKNGMIFYFNVAGNNHEIEMRIDRSNWDGKAISIQEQIEVTVNRVVPAKSERTGVPVKLCVQGSDGTLPPGAGGTTGGGTGGTAGLQCEKGRTGPDVLNELGFDQLLFEWRFDKIENLTCTTNIEGDSAGYKKGVFCDATQFSIAATKKAEVIKGVVAQLQGKTKDKVEGPVKPLEGTELNPYKNSLEMFRYAKKTVAVADNVSNQTFIFFVKGDSILQKPLSESDGGDRVGSVKGATPDTYAHVQEILTNTLTVMDKLSTNDKGNNVIGLIEATEDIKRKYDSVFKELGMEIIIIGSKSYYVSTFNELRELDKKINDDSTGCKGESKTSCDVTLGFKTPSKTKLTTDTLTGIGNNISVVSGIRSIAKDMSKEDKKFVMEQATDDIALPTGYSNYYDFHYKNIEFEAKLVKEGFSTDFVADFAKDSDYSAQNEITTNFKNWEFKTPKVEPGAYPTELKYDWKEGTADNQVKIEVKFGSATKSLSAIDSKYLNNQLFFMPIDGRVGYTDKKFDRQGYGSAYNSGNAGDVGIFVFAKYDPVTDPALYPRTYSSASSAEKNYTLTYTSTFKKSGGEKILEITGSEFKFAPTDPVAVEVSVKKTQGSTVAPGPLPQQPGPRNPQLPGTQPQQTGTNAGFQYKLNDGTTDVGGPGLLNWTVVSDSISGKSGGTIIADTENSANALTGSGSALLNGIILSGGSAGEIKLRTIIYAPTRVAQSNPTIDMKIVRDTGSIKYTDVIEEPARMILESNARNYTLTSDSTRVVEKYNLNDMQTFVKNKLLCIEGTASSTTFYWNGKEVLAKLG